MERRRAFTTISLVSLLDVVEEGLLQYCPVEAENDLVVKNGLKNWIENGGAVRHVLLVEAELPSCRPSPPRDLDQKRIRECLDVGDGGKHPGHRKEGVSLNDEKHNE